MSTRSDNPMASKNTVSKSELSMSIDEGIGYHRKWINNLAGLIIKHTGKRIKDKSSEDDVYRNLELSRWLTQHGTFLKKIKSFSPHIAAIDKRHRMLHQEYKAIHEILHINPYNRSLSYIAWTKTQKIVNDEEKLELKDKFVLLKESSLELVELMGKLKLALADVSYSELNETFSRKI